MQGNKNNSKGKIVLLIVYFLPDMDSVATNKIIPFWESIATIKNRRKSSFTPIVMSYSSTKTNIYKPIKNCKLNWTDE